MCFKTPVGQVLCLVITVILRLATAQSDTSSIETLVDGRLQKFEKKLMEKLQAQNREMIEKQAASFENLECFINNVIAGQLDLPKQMSNIMKENSRGQEKKLDVHATNAQKMAESIKILLNMNNILLADQLKNQNQLSSLTIDVQRLETHAAQEEAKLNEMHTLLRDTRVQNDQVIAKIDTHATNQMAESAKSLRNIKDDILTAQMELQKQMSNIMKENSREPVKLIEKLDAHATNVQQMTESINHLRNDTTDLLASNLENRKKLTSLTIDVQRLETHTDQETVKLSDIFMQNDQVIAKIDSHAANQTAESAKSLRIFKDDILTGQFELRKEFSNVKNELNSRVSDNEFQKHQRSTNAMYKEVIGKLADHATNAHKIAESIKNLGNITNNLLAGQSENQKQLVNAKTDLKHLISAVCPSSCTTLNVKITGTYCIRPAGTVEPFLARCDFEKNFNHGGGWTVFQHRYDGSVDFYRNWTAYRDGFGDVNGEYWLGLEKLHAMTKSGKHDLVILIADHEGNHSYALYDDFKIGSEDEKYKLTIGTYSGTAPNDLKRNDGMKFSTFDQDNDINSEHCAEYYHGAWWFDECFSCHLNGEYFKTGEHIRGSTKGLLWGHWKGWVYSLKSTKMMLRPRSE